MLDVCYPFSTDCAEQTAPHWSVIGDLKRGVRLLTQELGTLTSDPVVQIRLSFSSVKIKAVQLYAMQAQRGGGGRVIGPPIRKLSAKWGWANLLPGKIPSTYCTAVTRSLVKRVIGLWSEWSRNRVLIPRISKGFPFSSIHTGSEIRPASHLMGSFGQFVGPSSWPLTAIFRLVDVECRGRVRAVHWRVVSPQGEQQQMKWWTWSYG